MTPNEFQATLLCMERFGGSFTRNLSAALRSADSINRERLLQAFPEIIETYGPAGKFQQPTATPVA